MGRETEILCEMRDALFEPFSLYIYSKEGWAEEEWEKLQRHVTFR